MKTNRFQTFFGLALFFAALLLFVPNASARPHLRVGVPLAGTADVEQDASGHIYSTETDYAQAIANYAGYEAVLVPDTWDGCRAQLTDGRIDVLIGITPGQPGTEGMTLSRLTIGWQRLTTEPGPAGYHMQPLYFAVRAGNDALLRELNDASDRLMENRPGFLTTLEQIYADHGRRLGLRFTQKEAEYLRLHPVIPAVVVARERPFAYVDEAGEFQGTLRVFVDRIEQDLGVQLRVVPVADVAAAEAEIASGRAQVLLDSGWDPGWAQARRLWLTSPFYVSNYTAVTRKEGEGDTPVVAALDDRTTDRVLRRRYEDDQIRVYPNVVECMRAVEKGEADVTFVRQAAAQYSIFQGGYPDLVTDGTIAFSLEMAAGVSMDAPIELLTVLDKEIAYLGPETITNVAARHDKKVERERSIQSIYYMYPQYFVLAALTLFMLLVMFVMNYIITRRTHVRDMVRLLDEDRATHRKNRSWFRKQVARRLALEPKDTSELYIVFLGVQRIDIFTNSYGREPLMAFLGQMARALDIATWTSCVATHGSVGEIILLAKAPDIGALREHITVAMKQHEFATVGDIVVRVPLAAGICPIGVPPLKADEALARADFAMHEAQGILVYDDAMLERAHLTSRMESLQEQALAREEFEVWYQPKYALETRKCVGAEALVRWRSSELGFLPPGRFIPLFERNGFISQLDFYNLEHVMHFQHDAMAKGLPIVPISVNQSRVHMQEQGYLKKMRDLVTQFATDGIALELTETAFDFASHAQREHSLAVVAALHGLGFRIDMDDFGSGYSDLSLLNYLPFDVMKIDRSLLLASEGSERMRAVLQKMVELGHTLGMTVICEGIETPSQERLLLGCGCHYGQGYLYGKPMPREEFELFLKEHA